MAESGRPLPIARGLAGATIPADENLYERQIEATDAEIDELVCGLYKLTGKEIQIIDNG